MSKSLVAILILLVPPAAQASVTARVGDVTRLKGQGINYLTGMGLVEEFCRKLGAFTTNKLAANLRYTLLKLKQRRPCILIVDEGQFLLHNQAEAFEQFRDLVDMSNVGSAIFSHYRFVRALTNGLGQDLEQWTSRIDFHERLRGLQKKEIPMAVRYYTGLERVPADLVELVEEVALVRDRNSTLRNRQLPKGTKRLPANYYSLRRVEKLFARVVGLREIPINARAPLYDLADEAAKLLLSSSGSAL